MLRSGNLKMYSPFDIGGVRTLAGIGGFKIQEPPTRQNVKDFADMMGRKPVYGEDIPRLQEVYDAPDGLPGEQVMDAINASEMLDRISPRGVRGPRDLIEGAVVVIVTGGTINWMERRVNELARYAKEWQIAKVYALARNTRSCDSPTEVTHRFAVDYHVREGSYPREDYTLKWMLKKAGFAPTLVQGENLEDQVYVLMNIAKEIGHATIYWPTNANAYWTALRGRRVIRESYGSFDDDGQQFIWSQDSAALAGTPEQLADTANFQRPLTVLPAIGRTVEELFLLGEGQ